MARRRRGAQRAHLIPAGDKTKKNVDPRLDIYSILDCMRRGRESDDDVRTAWDVETTERRSVRASMACTAQWQWRREQRHSAPRNNRHIHATPASCAQIGGERKIRVSGCARPSVCARRRRWWWW